MKKGLCFLIILILMSATGCKKEEKNKNVATEFTAIELFTKEDATSLIGSEPDVSEENTRMKSSVLYTFQPVGQNDPIIIELFSPNQKRDAEKVNALYEDRREQRTSAQDIAGFGEKAFLAYPSLNIYKDGYMVVVTAGSGSDEAQKELLLRASSVVCERLDEFLKENSTNNK